MKYIKTFEEVGDSISVGDYVILDITDYKKLIIDDKAIQYINNNIGKVYDKSYYFIKVIYDDVIPGTNKNTTNVIYESIVDFDKSKEKLILRKNTRKYNL